MPLSDTSPGVKKLQMQIEAAMSGEDRILRALEASLLVREFAKSKIRSDHPDWAEEQSNAEMLRLQLLPGKHPSGLQ